MLQTELIVPVLGASGTGEHLHDLWWLVLAIVIFAIVMPVAYLAGRNGGRPQHS